MNFTFKKLGLTKKEVHKNEFCVELFFDDAHSTVNYFAEDEFKYFVLWTYTMKEYEKRLRQKWNSYCNPDTDCILDILKDVNDKYDLKCDLSSDDVYDTWAGSEEYSGECLARGDGYKISWFNDDAEQFDIDIIETRVDNSISQNFSNLGLK
jgi:hypothetical protein